MADSERTVMNVWISAKQKMEMTPSQPAWSW
jgi:hypothetical protein